MATKGKRTFWLTESSYNSHRTRAVQLGQLGFDVVFISKVHEILDAMREMRPACIILDVDTKTETSILKILRQIVQIPELSGTKFVLSLLSVAPEACKAAVTENVRDIIPFALPDDRWIARFRHATSSQPHELPRPHCEISLNQLAMAYAPARVVWISESHIRIECRGGQSIGSTLQISGELSKNLGAPYVTLTVESVHRNELVYRFSQALVCRWRVPDAYQDQAVTAVRRHIMANPNQSKRYRAFIAIGIPELRRAISRDLNKETFEVKVALLRSTLSNELAYFSPDVIFLDEKITSSLEDVELQLMAAKLDPKVRIIIYGTQVDLSKLTRVFARQLVRQETSYDPRQIRDAELSYNLKGDAAPGHAGDRRVHILPDQPWSRVELQMPARLTSLNPAVGHIALPFSLAAFAAIRLEAPILRKSLGRAPYIRVMATSESDHQAQNSQFAHYGMFYLTDVNPREEVILSETLLSTVSGYYSKQFMGVAQQTAQQEALTDANLPLAAGFATTTSSSRPDLARPAATSSTTAASTRPTIVQSAEKPTIVVKQARRKAAFKISDVIDPVIVKAVIVFAMAMGIVFGLLRLASQIDPSFYQNHGKQYSDFFIRMTDPDTKDGSDPNTP